MRKIWAVALISFKEGVRNKIIYGVLIGSAFMILFALVASGLFMRDILKVLLDICLASISIGGLLVPIFFAINQLAGDIDKKTIFAILAKSVTRTQYNLGRFFGLMILSGTIISIITLATFIAIHSAMLVYPGNLFTDFSAVSVLLASFSTFLGIQVLNSTVILWCSITTTPFLATLLTLSTYFIGQSVEDLVRFIEVQGAEVYISPATQVLLKIIYYIFPNLAAFDLKQQAAHGIHIPLQEISTLLIYCISYSAVMLLISNSFFEKRDIA